MRINKLFLTDFRNYSKKSLEFSPEITLIAGPNGAGKSNILEAIYCLATGNSWRTETAKDMVRFGAEAGHIIGNIKEDGGDVGLHLTLTGGTVAGKRTAAVLYKVDEVNRRRADFAGRLKVVLFEPESLEIVIGDPPRRRQFLDESLSQTDREYAHSLYSYTKALRIRNKLLDAIRDGRVKEETLEFWERTLVKHGSLIQQQRMELVEWFGDKLTDNSYKDYKKYNIQGISLRYIPNVISRDRLDMYRDREILAGFTFIGPQRDDFVISSIGGGSEARMDNRQSVAVAKPVSADGSDRRNRLTILASQTQPLPISVFGSRGEQRMAVLRLKLLEAKWIEEKTAEMPVLLLDDIFSELDSQHEKMVGELVRGRQTVMTATEIHPGHYPEAKVVELT